MNFLSRPSTDDDAPSPGRRRTLALSATGLLGGLEAACAAASAPPPAVDPNRNPGDVGRKFNADGTVHPFAGNTVIGRVPQQGPRFRVFDALLDIYREAPAFDFSRKLTMLPPSSYHVTLFGGVNDVDRHTPKWSTPLPDDTPIEAVNALYLQRLRQAARAPRHDFEFVCDTPPAAGVDGTLHVPLRPADAATAARLRTLRDELSTLTGIRRPDHDRYQYHVTIGYLHAVLDERETAQMQRAIADWMRRLDDRGLVLIPSFHYCTFRDMFAFEEKWEI